MTTEMMIWIMMIALYACTLLLSWRAGFYTGYDKGTDEGYDAGAAATKALDRVRRIEKRQKQQRRGRDAS